MRKLLGEDTNDLSAPALFCKCTCFADSKIIELGGSGSTDLPEGSTCNDCTKKFCLDYNLPICKDATEDDVFTQCFRMSPVVINPFRGPNSIAERDSAK